MLKSWQAQYFAHLGLRLRGRGSIWELSKGLGCCRARAAVGPHVAWHSQHFGQASAEIVAGAVLRAPGLAFAWQGQHLGAVKRAGVLSRARLWAPISRGRRRSLEMQVLKSWQAQYFVHLGLRSGACLCFFDAC